MAGWRWYGTLLEGRFANSLEQRYITASKELDLGLTKNEM
jgi:hypothetical protein